MAASATVGILRVLLTANSAEFESALKKAQGTAKAWSKDLQGIGRQATQIGAGLTKTLTLPLVGLGAAFIKVGLDFDEASDQIRSATGATGKALDGLNASFKKVLGTVPASTEDVATAIADLSTRTGQTGKSLEDLATQMLNLARVGNEDIKPLVRETTRLFGDWSISTDKQAESLDFLFKTSQATGIQVSQLSGTLVQFGAPLRALGFEFEQAAVLIGKFEKEGVNLETVLAGMRMGLKNFAKAGEEPAQVLERVIASIKNAGSEAEANSIAFQVFGQRAGIDMARAIREGRFNVDELVTSLKASKETINSAAADTLSFSDRMIQLGNRIKVAAEPIGTALVQGLERLLDILEPIISALGVLAKGFAALPGPIQAIVAGVGVLVAAAGPLLFIFGQLVLSSSALVGAFAKNGIAMRALTLDVTSLTVAKTGLAAAIRAVGAAMLAMPVASIVAGLGAVGLAVVALRQKYLDMGAEAAKAARQQVSTQGDAGRAAVLATLAEKERQLAQAIQDGNRALAARLQAEVSALKSDQTMLAMLDVINRARENEKRLLGENAKGQFTYAEAVKFNANAEAIRVASLNKSIEAQKRGIEAELALGRITQEQANLRLAALGVEQRVQEVRKANIGLAEAIALAEKKVRDEIAATGHTIPELTAALRQNEAGFKKWAEQNKLSAETVAFLEQQIQKTTKATKEAETAEAKREKQIEKQREALNKLGIVTKDSVNTALAELAILEKEATAGGAKHNVVLAAMLPLLRELHDKAVASGVGLDQTTAALRRAEEAAAALVDEMRALVPTLPLVVGLTDQVGRSVEIASLETANAAANARLLGQAYEHMGLKSRAELQKMAAASIDAFQRIVADGTATPEMISAAFEQMQKDVNAATGQIPSFWDTSVKPAILGAVDSISRGVADGFASMLAGAQSFAEGFKSIWESIKRAVINIFAEILDSFINGLLKGILGALFGQQGGFGAAFRTALGGGLAALFGGTTAAAAGAGAGAAGAGAGASAGTAGAAAGGGLLAGIAGGAGAGLAGFGLGQLGERLFGGPGAAAGAFGGASGFATGALIGSILPGIGTLVGGIIGGIGGLIGGLFGKSARRSTVEDFANRPEIGGFDELHRKLLEAGEERLWIELTQGKGPAVDAINAVIAALDRHQKKTAETAKATEEAAQREVEAREAQAAAIQSQIDTLSSEQQRLVDSIADEAPEEVMGVIEAQTRARLGQIETEKEALQRQLEEVVEAGRQALAELEREAAGVQQRLADRYKNGITIPITFDVDDEIHRPKFANPDPNFDPNEPRMGTFATGGIVPSIGAQYRALGGPAFPGRPKGMDRVPVWTTPGELILNEGQQGNIAESLDAAMRFVESAKADAMAFAGRQSLADLSRSLQTVTILEVDKRELGRVVADVLPNELRRLGVRVRS